MLKCILAEFMKVKRKKFVLGTLLAAWILPVPLTIIVVKAKLSFDILFMFAIEFGFFLILPIVLGIIASSSINVEYDNQTFKNMLSISISKGMMLWAKIIFLIFMSFLYGIGAMVSVTIGGVVLGDYASVMSKLGMAVLLSFMVALSILPVYIVTVLAAKKHIIPTVFTIAYTIVCFISSLKLVRLPLPLTTVFRWALPHISNNSRLINTAGNGKISEWIVTLPYCIGMIVLMSVVSIGLTTVILNNREV